MIISDLENKMNETLEQLALVQTQLEMNQNQSQIQIERLKQQLKGKKKCHYNDYIIKKIIYIYINIHKYIYK